MRGERVTQRLGVIYIPVDLLTVHARITVHLRILAKILITVHAQITVRLGNLAKILITVHARITVHMVILAKY